MAIFEVKSQFPKPQLTFVLFRFATLKEKCPVFTVEKIQFL